MATSSSAHSPHDVTPLVAAIARNAGEGTLGKFLEGYRWSVLTLYVRPTALQRGQLLIAQGARERSLYFLEAGDLKVDMKTDTGLVHLAILGPGTVVGEGGFFSGLPRSASVAAYSDCKVWEMEQTQFAALAHEHPTVALALSQALGAVLASRLLDVNKRLAVT
ncbi:Crp/Fnr family transcriptional regulator [Rhodoferax saidenbachensis]|uniref:CRP-like cAMP-binding protein n=1 Tax=Rhodoferax saidenbachensis TaxID=1484693 RepID=A0ABU1ZI79_9BURK|nr:Crp/Fnr family transcriptional regulator [Rhodoferax saidenbachensis]MDR7305244.1 CRP-like cAMP-binding protein [Rhodoferax saidenbachensis]